MSYGTEGDAIPKPPRKGKGMKGKKSSASSSFAPMVSRKVPTPPNKTLGNVTGSKKVKR